VRTVAWSLLGLLDLWLLWQTLPHAWGRRRGGVPSQGRCQLPVDGDATRVETR